MRNLVFGDIYEEARVRLQSSKKNHVTVQFFPENSIPNAGVGGLALGAGSREPGASIVLAHDVFTSLDFLDGQMAGSCLRSVRQVDRTRAVI